VLDAEDVPGLLDAARRPFRAAGVGKPWFTAYGNHDGLVQGNVPRNALFQQLSVGPLKPTSLPPSILAPWGQTLRLDGGPANGRNRRILPVVVRPGEGPLTDPIAGTQPRRRQPLKLPLFSRPLPL